MRYVLLFAVIQLVSLVLLIIGIPVCAGLAYTKSWSFDIRAQKVGGWSPSWAWLWSNEEDGVFAHWYEVAHPKWSPQRLAFMWTALRNPCNNLRYVPGVSKVGRPLWRKEWSMKAPTITTWLLPLPRFKLPIPYGLALVLKRYYAQAGWNHSGFPVLSAGINVNPAP